MFPSTMIKGIKKAFQWKKEGIMMKTLLFRSFVGICFGALVMVLTCFGVVAFGGH
ncbi:MULTISPECIES: hypothetical protein [unclassified Bacillus (in: firmicutes)]|uniref:hypothetical protein n=1 Tax=unclassified Bacillus (in: firmicutes) TaxID=185979 RepID=UPI001BECD95B|nr:MULTISPECIES: hypothetical protein [unclassified Bacillus (in: firmicutes)]MBT2616479.1 hypothetical protein [Bacillus sp. ISL-78]MBT2632605.1 hypothetical protein [Bacillus sp. ISL-101]MBT2719445.1 hypothetical protein [Bacillus sp. ISL-57]